MHQRRRSRSPTPFYLFSEPCGKCVMHEAISCSSRPPWWSHMPLGVYLVKTGSNKKCHHGIESACRSTSLPFSVLWGKRVRPDSGGFIAGHSAPPGGYRCPLGHTPCGREGPESAFLLRAYRPPTPPSLLFQCPGANAGGRRLYCRALSPPWWLQMPLGTYSMWPRGA